MSDPPLRSATRLAAQAYLLLLPVGHLVTVPAAGTTATGTDGVLLLLLAVWVVELAVRREARLGLWRALVGGDPGSRVLRGLLVLVGFGLWVLASRFWGLHPVYATGKGLGLTAMGLGAVALATSGLGWRRAVDSWLWGTGLALAATLGIAVLAPASLRERVFGGGLGVDGLPFPRPSGPFVHPNLFGDYLVVSGILLWGRFGELSGRGRAAGVGLAVALSVTLAATVSTAWIGAGVAAAALGWVLVREGRPGPGWGTGVVGVAVAVVTTAFVAFPLRVGVLGLELVTNGIRPAIWASSLEAFRASPWVGVGAAPYLARAADPLLGGAVGLWDAHNAYLSVLGQFGVVGFVLVGLGGWWVVRGVLGASGWRVGSTASAVSRRHLALGLALLAVVVNGVFAASEDMRHVWALMGMVGMVEVMGEEGG